MKTHAIINCLEPLLEAIQWQGERRHIAEALPYRGEEFDINDFIKTMSVLNYSCSQFKTHLEAIDPGFMPCLFITQQGQPMIILEKGDRDILAFDSDQCAKRQIPLTHLNGTAYYFKPAADLVIQPQNKKWIRGLFRQHFGLLIQILFLNLFISLLALSVPLFSMVVYDQVIASGSLSILSGFVVGVAIALLGYVILSRLLARTLSHLGTRLSNVIGNSVFERLLSLPAPYTESAPVSAQLLKLKDFDNLKDFLVSPLFNLLFELPFVVLFIMVIGVIAGALAYVPILILLIFVVLMLWLQPKVGRYVEESAYYQAERQDLILEVLQNLRAIKYTAIEPVWYERYRNLIATSALLIARSNLWNMFVSSISDALMMFSAMLILTFGVFSVLNASMTAGALIAVMMLMWRVLTPVKTLCTNLTRFVQLRSTVRQLNALMALEPERPKRFMTYSLPLLKGDVRFNHVSLCYPGSLDFALTNINLYAKSGEVVALVGRNGSGKSSLLKLLLGLYKPQGGSILIDGQDIRQMDPVELRRAMGYVPQKSEIIYGTLAQNLTLVDPLANEYDLQAALKRADLMDEINRLPDGLQTSVGDQDGLRLPTSFIQRMSLARLYLKKPPIMLFDEPASTLDPRSEQAFKNAIDYFRGHSTMFIITHRPSYLQLADRIVLIHEGQLLLAGPKEQVLPRLPREFLQ